MGREKACKGLLMLFWVFPFSLSGDSGAIAGTGNRHLRWKILLAGQSLFILHSPHFGRRATQVFLP